MLTLLTNPIYVFTTSPHKQKGEGTPSVNDRWDLSAALHTEQNRIVKEVKYRKKFVIILLTINVSTF